MSPRSQILTTLCGVKVNVVVERDPSGEAFALFETLTFCCEAAVTGTVNGLICKGCSEPVEPHLVGAGRQVFAEAAQAKGCPVPFKCASHTEWSADMTAEQLIASFDA